MPGFGQVDYSLVRPLTTGAERMDQMERLGTMREQRAGMRQNRAFQAENQQMGRVEYERDLNQIRQIKQAVMENTLDDGNLNESGFVKSLYGISPELAIQAQTAFGKQKETENSVWDKKGKVGGSELIDANEKMLDQYLASQSITQEERNALGILNKSGRGYDVTDWLKGVAQTRAKGFADIEPKKKEQEVLLPGKIKEASAIEKAKQNVLGDKRVFDQETDLSKQFQARSKDYISVRDSYNRIIASSENPSPAGDLALIFNYMKMLDPGSTVREGEFANAAASGSYGERFKAAAQKILSGERLTDDMRTDFVTRSKELFGQQQNTQNVLSEHYNNLSKGYGLTPNNVTGGLEKSVGKTKVWNEETQSFELK